MLNPELTARIEAEPCWTFRQCAGLAAEFGIKPRVVIAMVMMLGKEYRDTEAVSVPAGPSAPDDCPPDR